MDYIVSGAIDNLRVWVERFKAENVGKPTPPVVAAAEHLLMVSDPAAVEDREYHRVDLRLRESQQCGAHGPYGRVCKRRAEHVSADHRDLEISWKDGEQ